MLLTRSGTYRIALSSALCSERCTKACATFDQSRAQGLIESSQARGGALDAQTRCQEALWEHTSFLIGSPVSAELDAIATDDPLLRLVAESQTVLPLASACKPIEEVLEERTKRLNLESRDTPPVQLNFLKRIGLAILVSFVLASEPLSYVSGQTSLGSDVQSLSRFTEVRLLFGYLCGAILLLTNYAVDLSKPFDGVYVAVPVEVTTAMLFRARSELAAALGKERLDDGAWPL